MSKTIGTIEEAIKDIKEGKVILVIDDLIEKMRGIWYVQQNLQQLKM